MEASIEAHHAAGVTNEFYGCPSQSELYPFVYASTLSSVSKQLPWTRESPNLV